MKIRVKYSKLGNLRFIGHLDVMRYFQKEIRRAGLDICYTGGYSPHQIISFAAPLALGVTSDGEYFDAEFHSVTTSADMIDALNAVSVPDIKVTRCVLLPDTAKNAMSVVAASDYMITWKERTKETQTLLERLPAFTAQEEIVVLKKTKKNERMENIRSGILKFNEENGGIYMLLSTGSSYNLKPELVMRALYDACSLTYDIFQFRIHRLETYFEDEHGDLKPLYMAGEDMI